MTSARSLFALASLALAACGGSSKHANGVPAPSPGGHDIPAGKAPTGDAATIDARVMALVAKGAVSAQSYTVGTETVAFTAVDDVRLIVSASCLKDGKLACDAYQAVLHIGDKTVKIGPGTPSAYYCQPAGGEDVIATSAEGEDGLCKFPDGSMVEDWSFVYTPQMALGK